jgi:hypothetical protein
MIFPAPFKQEPMIEYNVPEFNIYADIPQSFNKASTAGA